MSYKDRKSFIAALRRQQIRAHCLLLMSKSKWSSKYMLGVKSWRDNWNEISTMYKYPPEIRKLIYTSNAIENFNSQLRKATKTKNAFASDNATMKILYLTTINVVAKWTMPIRGWASIIDNFAIYFGDRVKITK